MQEKLDKIIEWTKPVEEIHKNISEIKNNIEILYELDKLQELDDVLITVKKPNRNH